MTRALVTAIALGASLTALLWGQASAPAPTRIVTYSPPRELPARLAPGECWTSSIAASRRTDAYRCMSGNAVHDPCFATATSGHVLCDPDPADPASGLVLTLAKALPKNSPGQAATLAWRFELTDGSVCEPLTGTRREVDGVMEIYACRFSMPGLADAVLGELDTSSDVWTIQRVLINKKIEPQTIKSSMMAPVRTVWQ